MQASEGRWVRRGGRVVIVPGAEGVEGETGPIPATGAIHPRIDVDVQRALVRLSKGDAHSREAAHGLLGAVKSGALAGIYAEDQQAPALRARALKTSWWTLIPRGEDGDLVFHAREAPLLAIRNAARKDAARLDRVLRMLWARVQSLSRGAPATGSCRPIAGAALRVRDPVPGAWRNPFEGDLCNSISIPCTGTGIERAICDFRLRLNNPRLACNGQHYWSALAAEAVAMGPLGTPRTSANHPRGEALFSDLWGSYLDTIGPRDPAAMQAWFVQKHGRQVLQRDVDELWRVEANKCHNTVGFVAELLLGDGPSKRPNCLGSLGRSNLVSGETSSNGECRPRFRHDLPAKVARLRKVLDNGFYVKAGVPYPNHCDENTGHFLLILGHDGGNQFVYWNTVAHENADYGRAFGIIEYREKENRLQMRRGEYPVIYLHPLPTTGYSPKC